MDPIAYREVLDNTADILFTKKMGKKPHSSSLKETLRWGLKMASDSIYLFAGNRNTNSAIRFGDYVKSILINKDGSKNGRTPEQKAGKLFEAGHAHSTNKNSSAGLNFEFEAIVTHTPGQSYPEGGPDIIIVSNITGETLEEYQCKCGKDDKYPKGELKKPMYDDTEKFLVPKGQQDKIPETDKNGHTVDDHIEHDGIKSDPTTQEELLDAIEADDTGKTIILKEQIMTSLENAGRSAASGAVIGAVFSSIGNITKAVKGEIPPEEAALNVGKDTVKSASSSAAKAGVQDAIKYSCDWGVKKIADEGVKICGDIGMKKVCEKAAIMATQKVSQKLFGEVLKKVATVGMKTLSKVAGPIAGIGVDGAVDIWKYSNDKISGKEAAINTAKNTTVAGSIFAMEYPYILISSCCGPAVGPFVFAGLNIVHGIGGKKLVDMGYKKCFGD